MPGPVRARVGRQVRPLPPVASVFSYSLPLDKSSDWSAGVHMGPHPCHPSILGSRVYEAGGIVPARMYCVVCLLPCFRMLIGLHPLLHRGRTGCHRVMFERG